MKFFTVDKHSDKVAVTIEGTTYPLEMLVNDTLAYTDEGEPIKCYFRGLELADILSIPANVAANILNNANDNYSIEFAIQTMEAYGKEMETKIIDRFFFEAKSLANSRVCTLVKAYKKINNIK